MKMLKKKPVGQRRVYDIEVEGVHNFYANGINVHNCATDGGVSVIKDDGTVVDSATTGNCLNINFTSEGLFFDSNNGVFIRYSSFKDLDNGDAFEEIVGDTDSSAPNRFDNLARPSPKRLSINNDTELAAASTRNPFEGATVGLALYHLDYNDFANTLTAFVKPTYNTGWMNGDIKGAVLSDTDDTDLVGSGELVTNGTFDSDVSGWTDSSDGPSSISWNSSGYLQLDVIGSDRAKADNSIPTTAGNMYVVDVKTGGGDRYGVNLGTTLGNADIFSDGLDAEDKVITFVATSNTTHIRIFSSTAGGEQPLIDNISVKLADEDRSVNNNGLIVNGTVTRTPVATGADLVAYSGFSASNYLEAPYNPDLDFGTGDFCVMGWVKLEAGSSIAIFERLGADQDGLEASATDTTKTIYLYTQDGVNLEFKVDSVTTTATAYSGEWVFFTAAREAGELYFYINGVLKASQTAAGTVGDTDHILRVGNGIRYLTSSSAFLSLLRISATAPTAEQIKKIYEDEKVLFQENAQATLYGTSDAVTALAHDPVTDLLHVGTSDGRSVFQGLRRVDNTTDAVGTAISASNNLIVEE